ncbi:hypothetical protein [Fibrobacter sp. UWS1]|uniref:hypothetical protein n=1 Tax=Fibrobacter sp. UWS1 TaxID=1896220 RepID=UPI001E2E7474|nr:hypothetical protein [Fibrobacter sp. UWS1]
MKRGWPVRLRGASSDFERRRIVERRKEAFHCSEIGKISDTLVRISIAEGVYHEVRRMFAACQSRGRASADFDWGLALGLFA